MFNKLALYMRETAQEMKRVSWPTWRELRESTVVVLVTVGVVTVFIFFVDQILSFVQRQLILMT
ncbi:MAG: preprotein translocase subunit SecE [Candidatus Latescibacteria bacterium]|nr:preprotein translocase subunit SecE [Candidatus Latescibacterota bacterium]